MGFYFIFIIEAVGTNNKHIANGRFMCSRTVDRNDLRASFSTNGVGGEAFAVGAVININLLLFTNSCHIKPVAINGTRAFVINDGGGGNCSVQLCFEHNGLHGVVLFDSAQHCRD